MNDIKYRPGNFAGLHDTYPKVWEAVRDPRAVERMKILSRRGSPAIMAFDIDAELLWSTLESARERGELDHVKQMTGHQVRQIMESVGYRKILDSRPIRTSWIFASGAVYRKREWRQRLYVHRKRDVNAPEAYCIASKRQLSALSNPPPSCSTWIPYRMCRTRKELNFVLDANLDDDFGWSWKNLCDAVAERGYVVLECQSSN